jgi:AcrR family transcriptional regulator
MPKVVAEYKEEAKRRIALHAMDLFSKKGYHQTKMADIASSVGVSKGAIYQYFGSKTELLLTVFEVYVHQREQEVRTFLRNEGLESIATEKFFDRMLAIRPAGSLLTPDIVRELAENKAAIEWFKINSEKWVQTLAHLIDRQAEEIKIPPDATSESLARGILALRDGLYNSLSLGSDVRKVRKAWVDTMRVLMKQVLRHGFL